MFAILQSNKRFFLIKIVTQICMMNYYFKPFVNSSVKSQATNLYLINK